MTDINSQISANADLLRDAEASDIIREIAVADVLVRLTPAQHGLYRQESIASSECVIGQASMFEALEQMRRHGL